MKQVYVNNCSIGFWGLLAILFIALKLMNIITWSWWWVLAPLWAPVVFFLVAIIFLLVIYFTLRR